MPTATQHSMIRIQAENSKKITVTIVSTVVVKYITKTRLISKNHCGSEQYDNVVYGRIVNTLNNNYLQINKTIVLNG